MNFTIFTHAGIFHGDEVFATAAVRLLLPEVGVRRVRSPEAAEENDLVLDVGGVYNGTTRFDHHQKDGGPPSRENGCPRSSFGALWGSEWGRDIAGAVVGKYWTQAPFGAVDEVRNRVDKTLVQGVDALDAGASNLLPQGGVVEPRTVSHLISSFNPGWDEDQSRMDEAFQKAVVFAQDVLLREIKWAVSVEKARQKVMEGISFAQGSRSGGYNLERSFVREDARVLVLDEYVPWQEHIFERPDQENILYVVYPSLRGGWMAQQVPVEPGSFQGRKPFPSFWAGKRGWALGEAAGVICGDGPEVFCHPGRFILGTGDKQTTIQLACMACRHLE